MVIEDPMPGCQSVSMATCPLVVITGTNASHKSGLAITLALESAGEVVSADSRQVYRGLNIGAGKVTADERATVPHHLLDVVDVQERFTLANYLPLAHIAIHDISARGRLPFLVGGTGLYVSAVLQNYLIPRAAPDEALRRRLLALAPSELLNRLSQLDPKAACDIAPGNTRRLVRALEVCMQTGQPFSVLRRSGPRIYDALVLGLTWPRKSLYEMIDNRVDKRMDQGMVDEVRGLLESGITPERLHQLGLEYRIISAYLTGQIASQDEMVTILKNAIHAFARRQLTWLRRMPDIQWLDTSADYVKDARLLVRRFLAERSSVPSTKLAGPLSPGHHPNRIRHCHDDAG